MVLKAYYPLDEQSGTTAYDIRNNYNGNLSGGITQGSAGLFGESCYNFDGSDDRVDISNSELSNNITEKVSISAWVNPSQIQSSWNVITMRDGRDIYFNYSENTLKPKFGVLTGSSGTAKASSTTPSGEWTHVVGTYDGEKVKLYLDQSSQDEKAVSGTLSNPGNIFTIGYEPGKSYNFNGKIQHVRIYNHALTQQEINYLYSVGKRGLHTSDKRTL